MICFLEQGTIQLVSNETIVMKDQSYLIFKVERLYGVKGEAGFSWKAFHDSKMLPNLTGRVQFVNKNIQQIVKVHLNNASMERPTRIELFEPSNGYQLRKDKVVHISFVCKLLIKMS